MYNYTSLNISNCVRNQIFAELKLEFSTLLRNGTYSNQSVPIICTPDLTADTVVGWIYILVTCALSIIYVPTLVIMWRDNDLMSRACYQIIVWDAVCDLVQVLGLGLVSGIFTLTGTVVSRSLNLFLGSLINIAWLAGGIMDISLAFNRYLIVSSSFEKAQMFFGGNKSRIWLATAAVYGLAVNAGYLARGGGVLYDLTTYAWAYTDYVGSAENLVTKLEIAQDYITEPIMLAFCIAITVHMIKRRHNTSVAKLSKKEKMAVYQVFTLCCSLMIMNFFYLVVPTIIHSKWAVFAGNFFYLVVCGWTAIILLIFNNTLRSKVLHCFLIDKGNRVSAGQSTTGAATNVKEPIVVIETSRRTSFYSKP